MAKMANFGHSATAIVGQNDPNAAFVGQLQSAKEKQLGSRLYLSLWTLELSKICSGKEMTRFWKMTETVRFTHFAKAK